MIKPNCEESHRLENIESIRKKGERWTVKFACGCWDYRYRLIWENRNGKIPKGYIIHHLDGNETNDKLENLEIMSREEHARHHSTGRKLSDEHKQMLSEILTNNPKLKKAQKENWEKRKASDWEYPEEGKRKISEAMKGKYDGENNPFYGKHHSEETRKRISESKKGKPGPNKGRVFSEEARRNMSLGKLGKTSPRKGVKMSDETKKKISETKLANRKKKEKYEK